MSDIKNEFCLMSRRDLVEIIRDLYGKRFDGREVSSSVAVQVLGVSIATLDRWIDAGLVETTNRSDGARVVRKFDLGYLLRLDREEVSRKYKLLRK